MVFVIVLRKHAAQHLKRCDHFTVTALIAIIANNSHYKLYKNIISQDEVEKTLFAQPISEERDGEYRIGIKDDPGSRVAVAEESMVTILQTITPGTSVTIY